jgi:putative FmdB family regulatory protein
MPIYEFSCDNKKCETKTFEELCKLEEADQICCPNCNSKKVSKLLSLPVLTFAKPQESSKWDSFSYRADFNMEKAKAERRRAEETSHMGKHPYADIDDVTSRKEGIFDNDQEIRL